MRQWIQRLSKESALALLGEIKEYCSKSSQLKRKLATVETVKGYWGSEETLEFGRKKLDELLDGIPDFKVPDRYCAELDEGQKIELARWLETVESLRGAMRGRTSQAHGRHVAGTHGSRAEVVRAGSAAERLKQSYDLSWAQSVLALVATDREHFLKTMDLSTPFLLFGTTEGQRVIMGALGYFSSSKPEDRKAEDLLRLCTTALEPGEKETWRQVSNYWLKDALVLERTGRGAAVGAEPLEPPDLGRPETQRDAFLPAFRKAQVDRERQWSNDFTEPSRAWKQGASITESVRENRSEPLRQEDLICRRMCKGMLHIARYHDQKVLYSLDLIDLRAVAVGSVLRIVDTVSDGSEMEKVPVCTSELREIFRHADKLGDGVAFYHRLARVPPPWAEPADPIVLRLWADYAMHLTAKLLAKYPSDPPLFDFAQKIVGLVERQSWSDIIQGYHAVKPSQLMGQEQPKTRDRKDHQSRTEAGKVPPRDTSQLEIIDRTLRSLMALTMHVCPEPGLSKTGGFTATISSPMRIVETGLAHDGCELTETDESLFKLIGKRRGGRFIPVQELVRVRGGKLYLEGLEVESALSPSVGDALCKGFAVEKLVGVICEYLCASRKHAFAHLALLCELLSADPFVSKFEKRWASIPEDADSSDARAPAERALGDVLRAACKRVGESSLVIGLRFMELASKAGADPAYVDCQSGVVVLAQCAAALKPPGKDEGFEACAGETVKALLAATKGARSDVVAVLLATAARELLPCSGWTSLAPPEPESLRDLLVASALSVFHRQ